MGLPGLFSYLLKNYKPKNFLKQTLTHNTKSLMIDCNCLIHPQCFATLEEMKGEKNIDILEERMIINIIAYLEHIENFVKPTELMYISVDGIAPLAKIEQQRRRRYKFVCDNKIVQCIKDKYCVPYHNTWSNVSVSPGTCFMEKLHNRLQDHYKQKEHNKCGIHYIYSSFYDEGEGEHKILQHIKSSVMDDVIIYGLDADLILLSFVSGVQNIYLLRENNVFNPRGDNKLVYMYINVVKDTYNKKMQELTKTKNIDFIDDFVVLCLFLGNDFVPHTPSIDITNGAIELLMSIYMKIYNQIHQQLVINKTHINDIFLRMLIEELSKHEIEYLKRISTNTYKPFEPKHADECSKEIWNLENMKDNQNFIQTEGEWKNRYYNKYFGVLNEDPESIDTISKSYLEGITWTFQYYFKQCNNWRWHYPYNATPFISDVNRYIQKNKNVINDCMDVCTAHKPHLPMIVQLLSIIPPCYSNILPEEYRYLMEENSPISDMMPRSVQLITLNQNKFWKCSPMMPILDCERIDECVKSIECIKCA